MSKLHWENLNKRERALYMMYQMAGSSSRSSMLPDDCRECPICNTPSLSSGLCPSCSSEFSRLDRKLRA